VGDGVGVGSGGAGSSRPYLSSSVIVFSESRRWYLTRPGSTRWKRSKKSRSTKPAAATHVSQGDVVLGRQPLAAGFVGGYGRVERPADDRQVAKEVDQHRVQAPLHAGTDDALHHPVVVAVVGLELGSAGGQPVLHVEALERRVLNAPSEGSEGELQKRPMSMPM